MHCYYTTRFLIMLRRAASPALDVLRRDSVHPQLVSDPIRALHPVISSLYTQFSAEDISDQLQQAVVGLIAIEERCAALLALHASLASKHLAVVSSRLAAVATIFCRSRSWPGSSGRTSAPSSAASRDGRRS